MRVVNMTSRMTVAAIVALIASPSNHVSSFSVIRQNVQSSSSPLLKSHKATAAPLYGRGSSKLSLSYDDESNFNTEGVEDNQYTPPPLSEEQIARIQSTRKLDPLVASLTRTDETMRSAPTTNAPLIGEIPLDGSITVLIPAAIIAVVGFIYSFVVAFNARDAIVTSVEKVGSNINIPEMKYTETKVEDGVCRGLCSSQEQDLDNLRNFLGKISKQ